MMKTSSQLLFAWALCSLAPAQQAGGLLTQDALVGGTVPAEAALAPVVSEQIAAQTPAPAAPGLPQAEQMVRAGIMMLSQMQEILSGINNEETAEAAVAPLMRLNKSLQEWATAFTALPPLSPDEQLLYEENYLPIIEKLNSRLRSQGERLASAEYYGSKNLPMALVQLALLNQ